MDIKIFKCPGEEHCKKRRQQRDKGRNDLGVFRPKKLRMRESGGQNHIRDTRRGLFINHDKEFAFPCKWDGKLLEVSEQVSDII